MITTDTISFTIHSEKLSLAGAHYLAKLAASAAQKRNAPGAVAIVDDGGNLILAERWDNTMIAAVAIAIDKAVTAISFQRPTSDLEKTILSGRTPMLNPSNKITYCPLQGGYPIYIHGKLVGAIAIAGTLNAAWDEEIVVEVLNTFSNGY